MDTTYIFIIIVFSFIGMAYMAYGKKRSPYFLFSGFMMLLFPYFVNGTLWTIVTGVGLMLLPFALDWIYPY